MLSPEVALLSATLLASFSSSFSADLTKEGNIKYRQPPPREPVLNGMRTSCTLRLSLRCTRYTGSFIRSTKRDVTHILQSFQKRNAPLHQIGNETYVKGTLGDQGCKASPIKFRGAPNSQKLYSLLKNNLYRQAKHLTKDRRCVGGPHPYNDSSFNCHGAKFIATNGYFQPCNRHSHCYGSREPTDWCVMAPHFRWTNWGCHCDYKLGSCLIERYDYKSRQLQWGYCNLKSEFYCATHLDAFRERIATTTRKHQGTPTTTPKSRVDRKP